MKRVAAGPHLATPWVSEPAKRPLIAVHSSSGNFCEQVLYFTAELTGARLQAETGSEQCEGVWGRTDSCLVWAR